MSTGIIGADLEGLTLLTRDLERQAGSLRTLASGADAGIGALGRLWEGPDATGFQQRWRTVHRTRLQAAVAELLDAASTVERNRQAQERTSAVDGPGGLGGPETGLLTGGQPGGDHGAKTKIEDDVRIVGWDPVTAPLFASPDPWEGRIDPNDIDQRSLGDCYFVSALAGLANEDQLAIRDAIVDNGDGTYTVTLHERVDGELVPVEITVTNEMPVTERYNDDTDTWEAADGYTAGEADGELWPRIFEKAYAQMLGDGDLVAGYREVIGGDGAEALAVLTGAESETVGTGGLTIEDLGEMHADGVVLPASHRYIPDSGWWKFGRDTGGYDVGDDNFVTRHQYWVDEVDVDAGVVVVRNPWGYGDDYRYELTMEEFNDAFREIDYNPVS